MRKLTAILLLVLLGLNAQASLKSYSEWKTEKVQESLSKFKSTKDLIQTEKQKSDISSSALELYSKKLTHEQLSLELANELTISDYFILYFNNQTDPNKFAEISNKMSPKEISELLKAYSQTFNKSIDGFKSSSN